MSEIETLEKSIVAMDAQRAVLGDAIVDAMLALAREKLATLRMAQAAAEQRKYVTLLFSDVSGFTAMSEHLDPEEVTQLMNAYFQRWDYVIERHGGVVEKIVGDALIAVFGLKQAREHDPEYAIRAALEMRHVLARLNDDLIVPRIKRRLEMRVGINTGLVLVGKIGRGEDEGFSVTGETVNDAKRLEQAAPQGGILISHDTYRHVRGMFDVQQQEALQVPKRSEPLMVYLVERAKPRVFRQYTRGVEGLETRTIGRAEELRRLQTAWNEVLTQRRAQGVLVVGEAGIGKSRLLYELQHWMETSTNSEAWQDYTEKSFWGLHGRARAETVHTPYGLMRDVFMTRLQILEGDSLATACDKFTQGILELMPEDPQALVKAQFIGHLLGFDFSESKEVRDAMFDARQMRDRAFLYSEQLLMSLGARNPIVLLLEDVHWADEESLAWVETLLRATTQIPLLIVALARPSLFERRAGWGERAPMQSEHDARSPQSWRADSALFPKRIELSTLSESDSRALVGEILRRVRDLPESLRELIVSRAEGNPFYMEELIKMLIDRKVFVPNADNTLWDVDLTHLSEGAVPLTLAGVLQARLDRLAQAERGTLQRASVIGRIFWAQAVESLGRSAGATPLLGELQRREFVFARDVSTFADTTEYIFKHTLMRDVTYETVSKQQRYEYHALAARWLVQRTATQSSGQVDQLAGLIAEHYERAGQMGEAAAWYGRAGEAAQAAFANSAAQTYYALQLPLLSDPREQVETLLKLGAVHELTGQWGDAENCYQAALANATADMATMARCLQALGVLARQAGDYRAALAWLDQARANWELVQNHEALGHVLTEMGVVSWYLGDYVQAQLYSQKGLASARKIGDKHGMATAFLSLGNVAKNQGHYAVAQAMFEKAIALQRELGNKQGMSALLSSMGNLASTQGDYIQAGRLLEESLALNREIGNKWGIALALNNLGNMTWSQGNRVKAWTLYEESLALRQEMGDKRGVVSSHFNLGFIASEQQNYDRAHKLHCMSLVEAREIGDKLHIMYNLAGLAAVAIGLGETYRATLLASAAKSLTIAIKGVMASFLQKQHERTLIAARAALTPEDFAAAWEQGARLTLEEAIGYALQTEDAVVT